MNTRARQLAEIGLKAAGPEGAVPGGVRAMVNAFAAMLATPAATKVKPDRPKLAFTAQELHAALKSRVPHIVVTDLVNGQSFGAANKKLHGISGLTAEDLPRLIDWIEAGGLAWRTQSAPTFQLVAYKIEQWLNTARDWDRKGRPALGKRGVQQEPPLRDVGSSFK